MDINPICDPGCPRTVGRLKILSDLSLALGQKFDLEPLDCVPFVHGFGINCSDASTSVGIWRMKGVDLQDREYSVKFYVTKGESPALLRNDYLSRMYMLGPKSLLDAPPGVLAQKGIILPTYTDKNMRTFLQMVTQRQSALRKLSEALENGTRLSEQHAQNAAFYVGEQSPEPHDSE